MPNTNTQAITFTNTRARPFADLLYSAYLTAKKMQQEWTSQSVSTVIPNDSTVISDGAATDGRPQVTDADVNNLINRSGELISWLENGLSGSPFATNGATLSYLNTVTKGEVNGKSIF